MLSTRVGISVAYSGMTTNEVGACDDADTATSTASPASQESSTIDSHESGSEENDHFDPLDESFRLGSMIDEDDYSDSDSYSETGTGTGSSSDLQSSSCFSEDWSSDEEDDDYEELMATLPVALGRSSGHRPTSIQTPAVEPAKKASAPEGLPVPLTPLAAPEGLGEGLEMFKQIRQDLEKVGRMIVAKKDGEKFIQRAHILTSINWLSTHLPSCVLDHLGEEIRDSLASDKAGARSRQVALDHVTSVEISDDLSEASELSLHGEIEGDGDDDESVASDGEDCVPPESAVSDPERMVQISARSGSLKIKLHDSNQPTSGLRSSGTMHMNRRGSFFSADSTEKSLMLSAMPAVSYFQCALMFVDISGFTKLATRLDPENLSKVINSYFQLIVDKIFEFNGDIQKFAGDAIFAEWRESPTTSIAQCVEAASACSASMVRDCADYPVIAFGGIVQQAGGHGPPIASLNVHCGLGVGQMAGIHVGDSSNRREYLFLGDPIMQATRACDRAMHGEVVASPEFCNILTGKCFDDSIQVLGDSRVIATRDGATMKLPCCLDPKSTRIRTAKSRGITDHVDGLQVDALIEYRRLMSLYVHPVVVSNDIAASDNFRSSSAGEKTHEHHRQEAELRSVYVMFINPLIDLELTGVEEDDWQCVELLNKIMRLVSRELKQYSGHLRQFIVDDKGVVLIATFGLRGSTFPNLVSERALPATILLHQALEMELGVTSKIGATFGDVYCGAVGGVKRHEYAVMGPSVNLAARLMCSQDNPGVLVDNAVRQLASRSYGFNALDPVVAKGYTLPVPIFEPLSPLQRTWGQIEPNFVGRQNEITQISTTARNMMYRDDAQCSKMILVSSPSGMGKSTLLAHAIEHVRRMSGRRQRSLVIAKHAGREGDTLVPLSTIRPLFLKVLACYESSSDDKSHVSGASSHNSTKMSAYESLTARTASSSTILSAKHSEAILTAIGRELNAPPSYMCQVRRYLGFDVPILEESSFDKSVSSRSLANFLTKAFLLCTREAKLVLLAVDDVHRTDAMSWKVIRSLFEEAPNFLFVVSSPTVDNFLNTDQDFWAQLNDSYLESRRFSRFELSSLSQDDVVLMTMKALGLQRKDVDQELLNEVLVQSGGMPHFADKILEGIKKRKSSIGGVSLESDHSVAEIILHRVDSFDLAIRNTLNVGAVLGESFSLGDVLDVLKATNDAKEEDLRRQTIDSLRTAVDEGILYTGDRDSHKHSAAEVSAREFEESTEFKFYRRVWRTTLLGLMLDSRKRDVHRKIAQTMEARMADRHVTLEDRTKIFCHWKSSFDTNKATCSALAIGKDLENDPDRLPTAILFFEETLEMWGWTKPSNGGDSGLTKQVLELLSSDDLSNVIKLLVARGRSQTLCSLHKDAVVSYENALFVFEHNKISSVSDRSIIFPAFAGLAAAVADGHIQQDVYRRYEQSILRRFLKQTQMHGRFIHHVHALYLQVELYARLGQIDKAIAAQSVIKTLYKVEKHSKGLRNVYHQDSGALSFALCSFLHVVQGDHRLGLRETKRVLKELLPVVETDFEQSFAMIYPVALALKELGYASQARVVFDTVLSKQSSGSVARENASYLHAAYKPVMMLLALCSKDGVTEDHLQEIFAWASNREGMRFSTDVNLRLGRLGRCADSISAEICAVLAPHLPEGKKRIMVSRGLQMSCQSIAYNRMNCLKTSLKQAQSVQGILKALKKDSDQIPT